MDVTRTKRVIYSSLAVIALGVATFFVYRAFFQTVEEAARPEEQRVTGRVPVTGTPGETAGEELKETERPEISGEPEPILAALADFPVVSLALNPAGDKVLFYKKDGGGLFTSDFSGKNQEKISNLTIVGLIEALWTKTGDRAAVFYLDRDTLKGFIQVGTSSVTALPQDIKSFSWSPDGKSLTYLTHRDARLNLIITDSSGRNPKTLYSTLILDAQISWITPDRIAFQTAPSGLAEGFLFTLSRSSGILARTLGPLFGLTSLWSPDGSRVLIASTDSNGRNIGLTLHDSSGKSLFNLTPSTLPEKCFWAKTNEIYCAVPQTILVGAVWPDDYLRGEVNTSDRIVLFNLEKKTVTEILSSDLDVSSIVVSKNQDYLFFIDREDGIPWSLKLK